MEFRKLISFGKNSFVVSLPKAWIKKNKLSKGDTIYINETLDLLEISTKERKKAEQIKAIIINTKGKSIDQIRTEIVSIYLAGYTIMEMRGDEISKDAPKIKSILKELAGIELIEETNNKIVAKDLMNMEELSIKVLVRRIDLIVKGMLDDLTKTIDEPTMYESIYERDKEVNRLVYLALRLLRFAADSRRLRKSLKKRVIDLIRAWNVIGYLESMGDNTKRIARTLNNAELKPKQKKELHDLFSMIKKKYEDALRLYHTRDINSALNLELGQKKRLEMIKDFEKKNQELYDITYNLKSMVSSLKHISRAVMNTTI